MPQKTAWSYFLRLHSLSDSTNELVHSSYVMVLDQGQGQAQLRTRSSSTKGKFRLEFYKCNQILLCSYSHNASLVYLLFVKRDFYMCRRAVKVKFSITDNCTIIVDFGVFIHLLNLVRIIYTLIVSALEAASINKSSLILQ